MTSLPVAAVVPELLTALMPAAGFADRADRCREIDPLPLRLLEHGGIKGADYFAGAARLAARNVAQRLAELLNEKPGETVGYRVRARKAAWVADPAGSGDEGVLTRMIQRDPETHWRRVGDPR